MHSVSIAKQFGAGAAPALAVFLLTHLALASLPQLPFVWEPGCDDCVSWTGWPHRFIGYGGYVTEWHFDPTHFVSSLLVWCWIAVAFGLFAVIRSRRRKAIS
jgi:hypothetical protein